MAGKPREMYWELAEDELARRRRALLLRLVYAQAQPGGWDDQRLSEIDRRAIGVLASTRSHPRSDTTR